MPKPSSTPDWDTNGTNVVEPTAEKLDGWTFGQEPPSSYFNWYMALVSEWITYLDSLLTDANGNGVDDLVLETSASLVLSGVGHFYHGDEVLCIHPSALLSDGNGAYAHVVGGYYETSGAGSVELAIPLIAGDRIKSITFARYGNGSADFTSIALERYGVDAGAGPTLDISDSDSNPAAAWADKTVTSAPGPILGATETYNLRFNHSATGLRIGGIRITYDHPV